MQLASAWLILDKRGSNIPIKGLTPAELVLLVKDRQDIVGKFPIHDLQVIGDSRRSDEQERARLRAKYGHHPKDRTSFKVDLLYPGEEAVLPSTFKKLGDKYKAAFSKDASVQPENIQQDEKPWTEEELLALDTPEDKVEITEEKE